MRKTALIALTVLLILPTATNAGNRHRGRERLTNECSLPLILKQLPEENLDSAERADLVRMREEEKLARDIYLSLYEIWELRLFRNIARQEKTHMNAVRVLLRKYGMTDPAKGKGVGVFEDSQLQTLYGNLVQLGELSLADALGVGVLVEEMDIFDLQKAFSRTNNEDLATLYQNLEKGSRNHLRAFSSRLTAEGVEEYSAAYLSQSEYEEIADSPKEKGGVLDADGEYICGETRNRKRAP